MKKRQESKAANTGFAPLAHVGYACCYASEDPTQFLKGNGHANGEHVNDDVRPATDVAETTASDLRASARQMEFLRVLAKQIRDLGVRWLDTVSQAVTGKPLADLSSLDASRLISTLKEIRAGKLALAGVLSRGGLWGEDETTGPLRPTRSMPRCWPSSCVTTFCPARGPRRSLPPAVRLLPLGLRLR